MSERVGFLGTRRIKIHVTYLDPGKGITDLFSYLYPHASYPGRGYGEVKQLVI